MNQSLIHIDIKHDFALVLSGSLSTSHVLPLHPSLEPVLHVSPQEGLDCVTTQVKRFKEENWTAKLLFRCKNAP